MIASPDAGNVGTKLEQRMGVSCQLCIRSVQLYCRETSVKPIVKVHCVNRRTRSNNVLIMSNTDNYTARLVRGSSVSLVLFQCCEGTPAQYATVDLICSVLQDAVARVGELDAEPLGDRLVNDMRVCDKVKIQNGAIEDLGRKSTNVLSERIDETADVAVFVDLDIWRNSLLALRRARPESGKADLVLAPGVLKLGAADRACFRAVLGLKPGVKTRKAHQVTAWQDDQGSTGRINQIVRDRWSRPVLCGEWVHTDNALCLAVEVRWVALKLRQDFWPEG